MVVGFPPMPLHILGDPSMAKLSGVVAAYVFVHSHKLQLYVSSVSYSLPYL